MIHWHWDPQRWPAEMWPAEVGIHGVQDEITSRDVVSLVPKILMDAKAYAIVERVIT